MINLWMFLALCIVCVSGYIGQVLNVVSAVSSFFGMVILAALIYYFTRLAPLNLQTTSIT